MSAFASQSELPPALRERGKAGAPSAQGEGFSSLLERKVTSEDLAEVTRSLAVMVEARLPLAEAIEAAKEQAEKERLKETLEEVEEDLRAGRSLSEGLSRHAAFDDLYVELIRVGEEAGALGNVLMRLAGRLEKASALKRKARSALAYPAVVLSVALLATVFMLLVIVPTFEQMFQDFGAQLPFPTRMLLALSGFLTEYYLFMIGGGIAVGFALSKGFETPKGKELWDRFLLRLPIIGGLIRKSLLARFSRTLGTLLEGGVPLAEALEMLSSSASHAVLKEKTTAMFQAVKRGEELSRTAKSGELFPPVMSKMIAVGEQTAALGEMLLHLAGRYEEEVDRAAEGLASVLEPTLILLVGALVGGILVALYLPMFDLMSAIGG